MTETLLTDTRIADLGLRKEVVHAAEASGFQLCTPIQESTIPLSVAGRDVAGEARTGSGKTMAFLLGILHNLLENDKPRLPGQPRALIMAPTRELVVQINQDLEPLLEHLPFTSGFAYGGTGYRSQMSALQEGVDIVIATPGRLIDYLKQGVCNLKKAEVLVIDEADRMFELGFIKDIRYILRRLPPSGERMGMLFSATLGYKAVELAHEHLNDPKSIKITSGEGSKAKIEEHVYFPAKDEKMSLLAGLIIKTQPFRSIVFVNTRHMVRKVSDYLTRCGLPASGLSGDVPQNKRQKILDRFKAGEIQILVATDVAARGLHVTDLSHVFNFDLPQDPEDYVHRIGRTGRMDGQGLAISFACEDYAFTLPDIEKLTGKRLDRQDIETDMMGPEPTKPARSHAKHNSGNKRRPSNRRRSTSRSKS